MSLRPLVTILVLASVAAQGGSRLAERTRAADHAVPDADYRKHVVPILAKYCFSCHGGAKPKGGLALDKRKDDPAIDKDRTVWEKVAENLRSGEMPPKEKAQPTPAEVDRVLAWIDGQLSFLNRTGEKD